MKFFALAIMLVLSPVTQVFAVLDDKTTNSFAQNDITFYDPTEVACVAGPVSGSKVTIIGDSISVGARSEYSEQLPGADYQDKTYYGITYQITQGSKHFAANAEGNYAGLTIAEQMEQQGDLRSYVVFALGTNDPGAVTDAKIDELMDKIGTNHKVVLVTNYAYQDANDYSVNNAAIRNAPKRYPGKISVADWASAAAEKGDGLLGDAYVHPNAEGNKVFVKLIVQALNAFGGTSGNGEKAAANNKNYAGEQVWSDAEMEAIEANRAIYEEAANKYSFPWQVMAVVHSLETGLRRYSPSNGQGVYQLYSYTGGGTNSNRFEPAEEISEAEFRRQTLIAAEIISKTAGDLNDPKNVKSLFFGYNGRAGQYIEKAIKMGFSEEEAKVGEGSAYVMNRYDARRDPTSPEMSPLWSGRFVADGVYDENSVSNGFGAFVKYEAIAGGFSYCYGSEGGTIAQTAIELSWEGLGHDMNNPKPEYERAMKEVGAYRRGCNSGVCAPEGASCDQFVGTTMRYSGADPEFPIFGPAVQEEYMINHKDMYVEIEQDPEKLQAGDIFVSSEGNRHIYIYVGEIGGKKTRAEASFNNRTGEYFADWGVPFAEAGANYKVYRRINY